MSEDCEVRIRERLAVLEHALPLLIDGVKAIVDARFESSERALEHQFREYMRRLDDLNGEAGRLREMQSTYVPREVFDRQVGPMQRFQDNLTGRIAMISGVAALVSGVIGAVVTAYLAR